jgi:hypothetical protein
MMKKLLISLCERSLAIVAFYFPFIEISCYFGPKVFLSTDSAVLRAFYSNYIVKLSSFYSENNLLIFIVMIWLFIGCSRGTFPVTKFVRFNVIQAILLNIISTCIGVVFNFLPIAMRESVFGILFSNFLYLGMLILLIYSALLISYGRYPLIPVVSEAAKLQVQQGY